MTSKRFQARHGLDNNNQTITRVANPVNATDAANKQYVDAIGTTASNAIPATQKGVANGVSTLDATGNVPANQLANVPSAPKLATARAINGVSFDGTGNITVADSTKLPLTGGALTGSLTISSVEPQHVLEETNTTTRARTILSGGILYIQAGEMGQGANASSGNILFTGLNAQDVASLRVRTGGVSRDI